MVLRAKSWVSERGCDLRHKQRAWLYMGVNTVAAWGSRELERFGGGKMP